MSGRDHRRALALVGDAATTRTRSQFLAVVLPELQRLLGVAVDYRAGTGPKRAGDLVLSPTGARLRLRETPSLGPAIELLDDLAAPLAGIWQQLELAAALRAALRQCGEGGTGPAGDDPASESVLTDAERRVVDLLVAGLDNAAIADVLSVSRKAVEQHLTRVYRKLGVTSRTQLVLHFVRAA